MPDLVDETVRDDLVSVLRPYASRIELFGSVARREDGPDRDLDVLVRRRPEGERPPLGLKWFALEEELSERLGRPVEIVTERALSPHIRPHIASDRRGLYDITSFPQSRRFR